MAADKTPPRFVPTLTEVVRPGAPVSPFTPRTGPAVANRTELPLVPPTPPQPAASSAALEEQLVHRLVQRVDVALEYRLREVIAAVIQEQTRSVAARLREEIEAAVRQSVAEAVAEEIAVRPGP